MQRTRVIFFILATLLFLGYTGGWWGGQWYLTTGNTYFHFLGGLCIALLVTSYYATQFGKLSQPFKFFCILGIVMGVGVLWEFHEFILTKIVGQAFMGDLADTIKDLLMDTLGGVAGAFLNSLRGRNS